MALDIYVGSLNRYCAGNWESVVAQVAEASGIVHSTLRVGAGDEQTEDANPAEVASLVLSWQASLAQALGLEQTWEDTADQPYLTDRPEWRGYGALVLMAAHLEHPELVSPDEDPAEYEQSAAYQASWASYADRDEASEGQFPSLLGGAEWWLPLQGLTGTFQGPKPDGEAAGFGTVDLLVRELRTLAEAYDIGPEDLGEALIMGAPQEPGEETALEDPIREWGVFGLAVFAEQAGQAQQRQLPLLLNY